MNQQLSKEQKLELYNKLKNDYESVFNSTAGLNIVEDLKKSAFFYSSSFSSDSLQMAFNEGCRRVVLHIIDMAVVKPKTEEPTKAKTGE